MRKFLLAKDKFSVLVVVLGLACTNYCDGQTVYWNEIGGLYGNPLINNYHPTNCILYNNGILYAPYIDSLGYLTLGVWNGSAWQAHRVPDTIVDYSNGPEPYAICADNIGNIYIGGTIEEPNGDSLVVIKWDGNNWTSLQAVANEGYIVFSLFSDPNGNIYAAGDFSDTAGNEYIAKWNGTGWSELGCCQPPIDVDNLWNWSYMQSIWFYDNKIYAVASSVSSIIYVWDGNAWTSLPSLANQNIGNAYIADFCISPAGNIYANLSQPDIIAEWDGSSWQYLPQPPFNSYANGQGAVGTICVDSFENVYIAGNIYDQSGKGCVLKWDGNNWSELGINNFALNANSYISTILAAGVDNIFAIGNFKDSQGKFYIAESDTLPAGRLFAYLTPTPTNCSANGSIATTLYNGTPPYSYVWSNGATTANINSLSSATYFVTVSDAHGLITTGDIFVPDNCNSIISGTLFVDTDGTCTYNGQQAAIPNVILTLSGDSQTLYATTNAYGNYSFAINDTGNYYLYIQVGNGAACGNFKLCGNPNHVIHVPVLGDTLSGNNFGLTPDSSSFDLYLHPGWTTADPGFDKDYWIYFANNSPVPFNGIATVAFKYDSNLTFLSSDIPYTSYNSSNDSITWLVNNFNNNGWNYIGKIHFNVPSTLPLGYQLHNQFWIYPYVGDCDTSNNYLQYYETVKGSHDPNYKEVLPSGFISNKDSVFTYTIHYQNTGTDSTYFIIVRDTLSPYLNPATVSNLASSDGYSSFSISGNGVLTWTFNPLSLPSITTDTLGSQGFIIFSVKKMPEVPTGTNITNSASVYFDYNTGVITNTVSDSEAYIMNPAIMVTICSGSSYSFNNTLLAQPGTYYDTLASSLGYDSIVELNLAFKPTPQTSLTGSICQGDSYMFNDTLRTLTNTYTAIYVGSNSCDSIVALNLTVLPTPPQPNITQQSDSLISGNLTGNQWYFNDSVLVGDTSAVLVVNQMGNYSVQVTAPNGCQSSSAVYVYNGTGIQALQNAFTVLVYPNPNNGNFVVEFSDNGVKEVSVTDMLGQTVVTAKRVALKYEFDLSLLADGVYLLKINDLQNSNRAVYKQLVIHK